MTLKQNLVAVARPICRMIAALLWQAVWLIPFWAICLFAKWRLPFLIKSHFGIDQIQDRLTSLDHFAEVMKATTSVTNPTALLKYISTQFSKFTLSTRLYTIEMTSNMLQSACLWGLNLLMVAALVYAVIRALRLYRSKSEIYDTARTVSLVLRPEFYQLQMEIEKLREEIQQLKSDRLQEPEDVPQLPKE